MSIDDLDSMEQIAKQSGMAESDEHRAKNEGFKFTESPEGEEAVKNLRRTAAENLVRTVKRNMEQGGNKITAEESIKYYLQPEIGALESGQFNNDGYVRDLQRAKRLDGEQEGFQKPLARLKVVQDIGRIAAVLKKIESILATPKDERLNKDVRLFTNARGSNPDLNFTGSQELLDGVLGVDRSRPISGYSYTHGPDQSSFSLYETSTPGVYLQDFSKTDQAHGEENRRGIMVDPNSQENIVTENAK